MITRPVRVNFPCSYLSHINFRSQLAKTPVKEDAKKREAKPFVWMPNVSESLVKNHARNVVKKLDINAIVRNKMEEDLNLTVYSLVSNCSPAALHKHKKQNDPLQSRDQLLNSLLPHRDQLLTGMLKKCKESSTKTDNYKDILPSGDLRDHLCRCNKNVPGKRKPDRDKAHLPSNQQLDDMMAYFGVQAPALFASAGWTYQKATYNIIFENMILGTRTNSLNSYIMHINMMKYFVRMILRNPQVDIFQMTKSFNDGRIDIRWQINGTPRTLTKPFVFFGLWNGIIDGSSIFYINSSGLYYKHILMQMKLLKGNMTWPRSIQWMAGFRRRIELLSSPSKDCAVK